MRLASDLDRMVKTWPVGDVRTFGGQDAVGVAPRPDGIPTPEDEIRGLARQLAMHRAEMQALYATLMHSVGTIDTVVYEHQTIQLDPGTSTATLNLDPQTAQTEFITGLFCSITVPNLVLAPTITVTNAWAKLGGEYINLNAIINSSGGVGGFVPGNFKFILSSKSTRQVNLVASADWPAGAYLSFALFGEAVPTMLGGVLH